MNIEEIILYVVAGIAGYIWNRNTKTRQLKRDIDEWVSLVVEATINLRKAGLVKTDSAAWAEIDKRFEKYVTAAGIKLTPRQRLYYRQRAADQLAWQATEDDAITPFDPGDL